MDKTEQDVLSQVSTESEPCPSQRASSDGTVDLTAEIPAGSNSSQPQVESATKYKQHLKFLSPQEDLDPEVIPPEVVPEKRKKKTPAKAVKPDIKVEPLTPRVTRKAGRNSSPGPIPVDTNTPPTPASRSLGGRGKGKENNPAKSPSTAKPGEWLELDKKGSQRHVGYADQNGDVYRVQLQAISMDGTKYRGKLLQNGAVVTVPLAQTVADPGKTKLTQKQREAAAAKAAPSTGVTLSAPKLHPGVFHTPLQTPSPATPADTATQQTGWNGYSIPKSQLPLEASQTPPPAATSSQTEQTGGSAVPGQLLPADSNIGGATPAPPAGNPSQQAIPPPQLQPIQISARPTLEGLPDQSASETDQIAGNPANTGIQPAAVGTVNNQPAITITQDVLQALLANQQNGDNNSIMLANALRSTTVSLQQHISNSNSQMEALIERKTEPDEDKETVKQKTVSNYDVEVDQMVDDMEYTLTPARFLSMPTCLKTSQAMVPAKMKPIRTNYSLSEFGLVVNKFSAIYKCHDRRDSELQLKNFQTTNLARIDNRSSVKLAGQELKVRDSDTELNSKHQGLQALLNFHVISSQICPANTESLTLLTACYNYSFSGQPDPTAGDLAEVFVRWNLLRGDAIGKDEPVTYKTVYDLLKETVQNRLNRIASLNQQADAAKQQVAALSRGTKPYTNNNHPRGGGRGGKSNRGGRGGNQSTKRSATSSYSPSSKKQKGVQLCREFNLPTGCSRAPGADRCQVRGGLSLVHACSYIMPTGLHCGLNHPRAGNH